MQNGTFAMRAFCDFACATVRFLPVYHGILPFEHEKSTDNIFISEGRRAINIFYFCSVKKVIAIHFLLVFLMANTAFGQLLRLPTLIHHYNEHVAWDNSTLFEFLAEHYAATINHPDDQHHDHEKLPFKAGDCQPMPVVTIVSQSISLFTQVIPETISIKQSIQEQQFSSNAFLNSIWQPPRFS